MEDVWRASSLVGIKIKTWAEQIKWREEKSEFWDIYFFYLDNDHESVMND